MLSESNCLMERGCQWASPTHPISLDLLVSLLLDGSSRVDHRWCRYIGVRVTVCFTRAQANGGRHTFAPTLRFTHPYALLSSILLWTLKILKTHGNKSETLEAFYSYRPYLSGELATYIFYPRSWHYRCHEFSCSDLLRGRAPR